MLSNRYEAAAKASATVRRHRQSSKEYAEQFASAARARADECVAATIAARNAELAAITEREQTPMHYRTEADVRLALSVLREYAQAVLLELPESYNVASLYNDKKLERSLNKTLRASNRLLNELSKWEASDKTTNIIGLWED